jgi:phospholipase/carboxylesterase
MTRCSSCLRTLCWLLLAACGPSDSCAAESSGARAAAAPEFQAPDARGWGSVQGFRYLELVHGGARAEQRLPMVVLIHGLGDRPRQAWFDALKLDVTARVVMPEAPTPAGDGFSWFPFRVGQNEPKALARGISAACERLARAVETLRAERPTLGKPIVGGFSQGGMLSFALALRHPELIAFALPISGALPEPLWPEAHAPAGAPAIVALHGTADTIVPFEPTRRLVERLHGLGYDASLLSYAGVGHAIAEPMLPSIRARLSAAVNRVAAESAAKP